MAYVKNTWVDQKVQRPKTYNFTTNDDGSTTLIDAFGNVEELGTPVNADNMNHIEEGLSNVGTWAYSETVTYDKDDAVIGIVDDNFVLCRSLQNGNKGNPLTKSDYWEEVKLGGGGLEIGDIGIASLGIDETKGKRRYLNGQVIIQEQYVQFTNKVKSAVALYPSLACTESEWQTTATMTVGGQVGKFVVDDNAGTIRLPKIIMPIQGLTDLSKLAEIVKAGLPNITGVLNNYTGSNGASRIGFGATGAFYPISRDDRWSNADNATHDAWGAGFDASRSNPIYGNSDTVQQEQIQYPYFIQVATGQETENNIVNDIELNNPYVLFDNKYVGTPLYNLSWLKSDGEYKPKATYPKPYEALAVENNSSIAVGTTVDLPSGTKYTKRGLSVKLSTASDITDYDLVINTTDETFRLPLKNHSADDGNANLILYYYIGETVQNANLINAGRIEENLTNKVDLNFNNMNPSQTAKNTIVGWVIPDYSAGVAVSLNGVSTTFTVPIDGFLFVQGQSIPGGKTVRCDIYNPNDTLVKEWIVAGGENVQAYVVSTGIFPIPKSYKCIIWCHSNPQIIFYPMKGAK